ncbi:MAG: hypothetical protein RI897_3646 [Verrucomicrobiota bacterium]
MSRLLQGCISAGCWRGWILRFAYAGLVVLLLGGGMVLAQRMGGRGGWYRMGEVRTARELAGRGSLAPDWENAEGFEADVFTFARVRYESGGRYGRGGWETDIPDSDLNLSYRLQQMTSMRVDPDGRVIRLTDGDLSDYPFIYIVEPGGLRLSADEVLCLRDYLENGGFLMLDDFWGEDEWRNCEEVMGEVLPGHEFQEVPLDHALYSTVFKVEAKYQLPNVRTGIESQWTGRTWERDDAREVHHRGIFDSRGRLMVIAFHNTDNGDGWEWEGHDNYYFRNFSEKIAYPLAINTLVYVMTH